MMTAEKRYVMMNEGSLAQNKENMILTLGLYFAFQV